jgi:biopolymer transport protein ExbB/TolQ
MADGLAFFVILGLVAIPLMVLYVRRREQNRRDRDELRRLEAEIRDVKYQEENIEQQNNDDN